MNLFLALSAAAGMGAALGHSYLGETRVLRPMFGARGDNRTLANVATRRVIRWVWHLPSLAWAQIAAVTFWFAVGLAAPAPVLTSFAYFGAAVYLTGALANLWALRKPHIGSGLLTLAAVALALGAT